MNTEVLKKLQPEIRTKKIPVIKPGYTVEIDTLIREGNKQRVQKFRGLVLTVTGEGTDQLITVRKISYGFGVEKKIPVYSSNIGEIKVIKKEKVRRSKLYFMRDRVGKSAMRIKKGKSIFVTEDDINYLEQYEPEVEALVDDVESTEVAQEENTSEAAE